jgi:hypothetical protein
LERLYHNRRSMVDETMEAIEAFEGEFSMIDLMQKLHQPYKKTHALLLLVRDSTKMAKAGHKSLKLTSRLVGKQRFWKLS